MAYNNNFPVNYQPYYPSQYNSYPMQNSAASSQSSIIWVQGEAGAKSYLVAPNTTVQLWDSENQTIYLKSADASGMPSIKTLDYTVRNQPSEAISAIGQTNTYKEELNAIQGQIDSLRHDLDELRKGAAND